MAVKVHQLMREVPAIGRKWRTPKFRFQIEAKPYQIQPFMIAPVLPGDTLKAGLFQSRVVSDPIKNPLIGWHQEYYFFYVKLTDLEIRDRIPDIFMTEGHVTTDLHRPANPKTFHNGGSIDWVYESLRRITKEYFRDEQENWDVAMLDGLPLAQAFGREDNWADSLAKDDDLPEATDTTNELGELYGEAYAKWEGMKKLKLMKMTFEEYLEHVYGVDAPAAKVDPHRPELLRYVKDWTYPSNTINPADGAPSSALSWSIAERIDKNRFFAEPGFVVGVTVTRPKVYLKNQTGTATSLLASGERWLPSVVLGEEPHTSVVNIPATKGPTPNIVDDGGYWVDVADLFMYGEQFVNFETTADGRSFVSLPTATGSFKYVASADIDGLFKTATANKIRQDGVVDLRILSRITDTTK